MGHKTLKALLPQIDQITDADLREKTLNAFLIAIEQSGWTEKTMTMAPVSGLKKNCDVSLFEHLYDVTEMVIAAYDRLEKYYQRHCSQLNRDILICGALLHDVGKFLEYGPNGPNVNNRSTGPLLRHPISGALIAKEADLPEEVIHIIATHSCEGDSVSRTPESDFVRDIDMFVFHKSVYGM